MRSMYFKKENEKKWLGKIQKNEKLEKNIIYSCVCVIVKSKKNEKLAGN